MSMSETQVGIAFVAAFTLGALLINDLGRRVNKVYGPISKENLAQGPIAVDLTEGEAKYICRCGQSSNFPYCDGSHKAYNASHGTNYSPMKVTQESAGKDKVYVCACGRSKNRSSTSSPFCDGSHRSK